MLSMWEELALIAKCATTDSRSAFERLVVEYSPELRRYLMNLTLGDASLTDDLAQDTFLKAYMSIRSFQGLSRFKTWLFRIAINEYYAYVRKRREQRMDGMAETPVIECVTPLRNVEAGIDAQKCLAVLSETERSVVLLFYMNDLPIKEIVKITGMPEGTVKSHLSRAKVKMAKVFNV
ncbi:RNA polymerase sigma factor [Muribaculum caecicola]|uniref:RNA polymerase sigma factor n=1 Tax=Muribaculum caecicola TaxID=3038144 RepID=A0AC61S3T0_9BACT|nr:RNA polymerase sigma factor [Muribaculum caecicola]THG43058.1 RNA polymerase sigma factor [Muribaculum caecicola]